MNNKLLRYVVSADIKPNNGKVMIWNLSILIKKTLTIMNVSKMLKYVIYLIKFV